MKSVKADGLIGSKGTESLILYVNFSVHQAFTSDDSAHL